jgi:Leucine-rich repeat (LRR) protein
MANDLEIIKRLEKETGERLEKVEFNERGYCQEGYVVDEENRVVGLNLSEKESTKIPHEISKLSHLIVLMLWGNNIVDISPIKELRNLKILFLIMNQISDISVLKDLSNLTKLNLSYNQISDISVLKSLSNLTLLDLSRNKISDISVLKDLSNLTKLYLSNNQISDISKVVGDRPEFAFQNLMDEMRRIWEILNSSGEGEESNLEGEFIGLGF